MHRGVETAICNRADYALGKSPQPRTMSSAAPMHERLAQGPHMYTSGQDDAVEQTTGEKSRAYVH